MNEFLDFLLLLLSQFAGGPGPKENNLMRFGLPAVLWGALLVVAWSRQRRQELPREKLLIWGFGLGLTRDLFMFSHVSMQLLGADHGTGGYFTEPLEHALTMAALVVVTAAFLRYISNDFRLARRYLQIGLVATGFCTLVTTWWWVQYAPVNPGSRFNMTWGGALFHAATLAFLVTAIVLLARKRGWLRNVVSVALTFFCLYDSLKLVNMVTSRAYSFLLCPISNSLHILAIPLLGYVYLREQSIEKHLADQELKAHRDHLEELVADRTTELMGINRQLQREVSERKQAELEIARRSGQLNAQNAIAATISQSLDLDTVLNMAMDRVLSVFEVEVGSVYLLEPDRHTLLLQVHRGRMSLPELDESARRGCPCAGICKQAIDEMRTIVADVSGYTTEFQSPLILEEELQTLVSTPLVSHDQAVGALTLGARRPNAIHSQDLGLLAAIGQQIGMAVENARLYREVERRAEELALLHQVSLFLNSTLEPDEILKHITEQSVKLLGCQAAIFFRWDKEQQEAVGVSSHGLDRPEDKELRARPGEWGILPELIGHRRSVAIEDAQSDDRIPSPWRERLNARVLLCVPVWGASNPLGFLFMIGRRETRRWRPDEVELLESFVNRAAVALENAYLHKQLEWAAALEERQRIAAEMHDGLAQTLSLMGLRIDRATELIETGGERDAMDELHHVRGAVEQASREVRQSLSSLQESPPPHRPLQELLSEALTRFAVDGGPPVDLTNRVRDSLFLPPANVEQVLRVVQEALLNARRHAQAGQIAVLLEERADEISVVVQDDGRGFDPAAPQQQGDEDHFGLNIMRARAARIGGKLQIISEPDRGTRVILTWPSGVE